MRLDISAILRTMTRKTAILSTLVFIILAATIASGLRNATRATNEHQYRLQLTHWTQQIEDSSKRLTHAMTESSIDYAAVNAEFDMLVLLDAELRTAYVPDKYTQTHAALLQSVHFYKQALYAFKIGNFASGRRWLQQAGNAYTNITK